jgi:hypothetical protein
VRIVNFVNKTKIQNPDLFVCVVACLAEIEEIRPLAGRKECDILFTEAVNSARMDYSDMHIYPYTMYASYLSRHEKYKPAIKHWADAARVIQK